MLSLPKPGQMTTGQNAPAGAAASRTDESRKISFDVNCCIVVSFCVVRSVILFVILDLCEAFPIDPKFEIWIHSHFGRFLTAQEFFRDSVPVAVKTASHTIGDVFGFFSFFQFGSICDLFDLSSRRCKK